MSTHTYDRLAGYGGIAFAKDIEAALPGKRFRVACAVDCVITFEAELTVGEVTTLDAAVAAFSDLSDQKVSRTAEIDERTRELIDIAQITGEGVVANITSAAVTLRTAVDAARDQGELDAVTDIRTP